MYPGSRYIDNPGRQPYEAGRLGIVHTAVIFDCGALESLRVLNLSLMTRLVSMDDRGRRNSKAGQESMVMCI